MLYKGYSIELWKTDWIGKRINGEWYSLHTYFYHDERTPGCQYEYIAIIDQLNPPRGYQILGASTPKIALDLAKFSIDLYLVNRRRWNEKR